MDPVRPALLPEASLSREEMKARQREVAETAVFDDRFDCGAGAVDLGNVTLETVDVASDERPLVAGIDQAFVDDVALSAVVVLRGDTVVERTHAVTALSTPYIPGLLSFREGAAIIAALGTLDCDPDLLCFDGSGRLHYRQAGLATHIGVVFDVPAIGVAKRLLCGTPRESTAGRPAGWRTPIAAASDDNGRGVDAPPETVVGYAYQSRQYDSPNRHINPLYVSPGHRLSAETTVDLVAALCDGYKLPEPTRLADSYADEIKNELPEADGLADVAELQEAGGLSAAEDTKTGSSADGV